MRFWNKHRLYSEGWDAYVLERPFIPDASDSWRSGYSDAHLVEAKYPFANPQSSHERNRAFAVHPQGNPHWQHIDDMKEHYRQGRVRYRAVLFDVILWAILFAAFVAAIVGLTNSFVTVRVPPVTYHDRFGAISWTLYSDPTMTAP